MLYHLSEARDKYAYGDTTMWFVSPVDNGFF